MIKLPLRETLTFDDVLLAPRRARVHPKDVDVATRFTRDIRLAIPLVSAAMDTVTENQMAIAVAREGGIGIIHKNMSTEAQCAQVDRVKRSESGMILKPITLGPGAPLRRATRLMGEFSISGVPIVDTDDVLVGIITNRDLIFETNLDRPIREVMTSEGLVTAPTGTSLEDAEQMLREHKIEKLPVVGVCTRTPARMSMAGCWSARRSDPRGTIWNGRGSWSTQGAMSSWSIRRTGMRRWCWRP
jgi:IMP dehydrogenase